MKKSKLEAGTVLETGKSRSAMLTEAFEQNGKKQKPTPIDLPSFDFKVMEVTVVGISPLIVHNWSNKQLDGILKKHMGEATLPKSPKVPLDDFRSSLYVLPGGKGYGFPAPGFKASLVTGGKGADMVMTEIRQYVHVSFYTVPILADPLPEDLYTDWDKKYKKELKVEHSFGVSMRCDVVRLESGVVDLRFRGSFPQWKCKLKIEFNCGMISPQKLVHLVRAAGQGGVGEWRPTAPKSRSGEYGRFDVDMSEQISVYPFNAGKQFNIVEVNEGRQD